MIEGYGVVVIDYVIMLVVDYVQQYIDGEGFDVIYDMVGGVMLDVLFEVVCLYYGYVVSVLGWGIYVLVLLLFCVGIYFGVFILCLLFIGQGCVYYGEILCEVI